MNIDQILSQVIRHSQKHGVISAKNTLQELLEKTDLKDALLNNLGLHFYKNVEYELARHTFFYALSKTSNNYAIHNNLGLTLNRLGLGSEAATHYQKALEIKPDYHNARSNLAYSMLYFGETGRPEILQAHKDIAQLALAKPINYINGKSKSLGSNGKISVGYVSSDFRNHAVGRFMCGILEEHNREKFEIHIFDNRKNNSDQTALKLKKLDLTWHNISELSTQDSISLIQEHKVDILIDLSGHTNGGRPDIFTHRVCPIQATYLGYPCTSGIPNMDFRIGDDFADLIELSEQNTETMLRLPVAMWNYQSWPDMPNDLSDNPFKKNGYITFGSVNNHAKLQKPWIEVWAKMIASIPNSKILFKSRALKSPEIRHAILDTFESAGVGSDRIKLIHYSPTKLEHWNTLNEIDIALDTFPYNGTTTSCDLLSLGIPIVTLSGQSHVSRTTGSILHTLGLESWIAKSKNEFIHICQKKSQNLNALSNLKKEIPTHFKNSSLGNSQIFIQHYEELLENAFAKKVN